MSKNTLTLLLFLVAISLLTLGCDDGKLKTYPVSGIVTMNGEPVARATVIFSPVKEGEGDAATGITNAQGEYKLQTAQGKVDAGTTPGEYVVMIKKTEFFETGKVTTDSSGRTSAVMDSREALPARYKSFSSPFKETVEPKRNTFNFALED